MKQWINTLIILLVLVLCIPHGVCGQDDLLDLLDKKQLPVTHPIIATFKSTRLVSGHSVETHAQGVLQFLIGHRFGRLNTGWRDLFGVDNATVRLGLEYGITDNINVGIGRSSFQKTYDATAKWRFLRQKNGAKKFPFSATFVSAVYLNTQEWANPDRINYFSSRLRYHHALLLAKKVHKMLSLQLMPTIVHSNLVPLEEDNNTIYAMGVGASVRLSGSLRANIEYYYIPSHQIVSTIGGERVRNTLSIGLDLETGGHVFQLHVTNSRGMSENFLVGQTTGDWLKGDIHFGFNISRVFTLKKPNKFNHETSQE